MHIGLVFMQVFLLFFINTIQIAKAIQLNQKAKAVDKRFPEWSAVPVNPFSYTGFTGPLGWTGLDPHNAACSTSRIQSPINLDKSIRPPPSKPVFTFGPVESAEFENLRTTVEVVLTAGTVTLGRKEYVLQQFHFHTPSEHRIELEYFPFEIHFVYKSPDGASLALGALFEVTMDGSTTDLLTSLAARLGAITKPGSVTQTGPLDLQPIQRFFETTPLFYYVGSLTTPPCNDGVVWLIAKTTLPINVETFLMFKKVLKFNSRYTQNVLGQQNLIEVAADNLPK